MKNLLQNKKHIHFIGIGGSGMYPLAQILHNKGFFLTGSDNNPTDTVDAVKEMGIEVFMGHFPTNVLGADLIVRSAAIKDDNPEIIAAREKGIEIIERADLLGWITKQYEKAICVSGTHGKTTVSSMLVYIFMAEAQDTDAADTSPADISAVIGGKLKILNGGSGRVGTSDIMICEACEYADTFLKLAPDISVILNIDRDHLEYFKTMDNLRLSFTKFCDITSDTLVVNGDDSNTMQAVNNSGFKGRIITFGQGKDNDYYPENIVDSRFDLVKQGKLLAHIKLNVPGEHNIMNAVAACAVADSMGRGISAVVKGIEAFTGAGRRFEILSRCDGITVIDDYAHHPAEITATLKAAREYMRSTAGSGGNQRLWAVHQPFTYSRTASMLDEFAVSLSIADKVTLTQIMGGREVNDSRVCSEDLANKINSETPGLCNWLAEFEETCAYIVENSQIGDHIITLGCGDVNRLAHMIVKNL